MRLKYLSANSKTGVSINLPIKGHCNPTELCSKICYAKMGHTALPTSKAKQIRVSVYLMGGDITELISECGQFTHVRMNGTGDFLEVHLDNILYLAQMNPHTMFYGMTKKPFVAERLNNKFKNPFFNHFSSMTSTYILKLSHSENVTKECWIPFP